MSVKKKNRRKITVNDRLFIWYIAEANSTLDQTLFVVSEDKKFIVHYILKQTSNEPYFVEVVGKEIGGLVREKQTKVNIISPTWEIENTITPKSVRNLITWCLSTTPKQIHIRPEIKKSI